MTWSKRNGGTPTISTCTPTTNAKDTWSTDWRQAPRCLFTSAGAADGTFTQLALEVGDIEAEVAALRRRGAVFQTYPAFAMSDGIADIGGEPGRGPADRAAWFHDANHNLISLYQFQSTIS